MLVVCVVRYGGATINVKSEIGEDADWVLPHWNIWFPYTNVRISLTHWNFFNIQTRYNFINFSYRYFRKIAEHWCPIFPGSNDILLSVETLGERYKCWRVVFAARVGRRLAVRITPGSINVRTIGWIRTNNFLNILWWGSNHSSKKEWSVVTAPIMTGCHYLVCGTRYLWKFNLVQISVHSKLVWSHICSKKHTNYEKI